MISCAKVTYELSSSKTGVACIWLGGPTFCRFHCGTGIFRGRLLFCPSEGTLTVDPSPCSHLKLATSSFPLTLSTAAPPICNAPNPQIGHSEALKPTPVQTHKLPQLLTIYLTPLHATTDSWYKVHAPSRLTSDSCSDQFTHFWSNFGWSSVVHSKSLC